MNKAELVSFIEKIFTIILLVVVLNTFYVLSSSPMLILLLRILVLVLSLKIGRRNLSDFHTTQ